MEDERSNRFWGTKIAMEEIIGIYEHFDGELYIVFGEGRHTETGEEIIVYKPLSDGYGNFSVTPKTVFFEEFEVAGTPSQVFRKLSEQETIEKLASLLEKSIPEL